MSKLRPSHTAFIPSIAAILAACCAVFFLPWQFPSSAPAVGESFSLGFNNKVAVLGLAVTIAAFTLWRAFVSKGDVVGSEAPGWFRESHLGVWQAIRDGTPAELIILTAACLGMTQVVLWWDTKLAVPYWGEADYFLSRIDLVAIGYRPYVDFSYLYGPANLYVPLWLDWLSQGSLGLERAYAWTVASGYVAGFVCNYVFLSALAVPREWRPIVLALCLAMWIPLTMGMQYTPVRFTVVPCGLAILYHASQRPARDLRSFLRAAAVAGGGCAAAFLLSPEMGIVSCVATLVFAAWLLMNRGYRAAMTIATSAIVVALAIHWTFPGYFLGVQAFTAGAMNFPIYPNFHNVLLVAVAVYVISHLGFAALTQREDNRSAFMASLAAANTLMLSPALGRCDPGHVGLNACMLFMIMFAAAAARGRRLFVTWAAIFGLAMIGLNQVSYWGHYLPTFRQAFAVERFYKTNPDIVFQWQQSWEQRLRESGFLGRVNWRRVAPFPDWATQITSSGLIALPIGGDIGLDRFVKTQPDYRAPFHPPPKPDIHLPADVDRAAEDASRSELILLPEYAVAASQQGDKIDQAAFEAGTSEFLSGLMVFPIRARMLKQPFLPDFELCRRLAEGSEMARTEAGYVVLRRARNESPRARVSP